jgi:hypothetical protein
MEELGSLARVDVDDLQLGQQVVGQEQPVQQSQYPRMVHEPVAGAGLAEHAVDALRAFALERVPAGPVQQGRDGRAYPLAFLRADQVLQDDVTVALEGGEIGVDDRGVRGGPDARGGRVPPSQIETQVLQIGDPVRLS